MDPKTVEKLEDKIEDAIAEIIVKMGVRKLPLLPSQQTMHLMAKAAVAVYEAAVENYDRGRPAKEPVDECSAFPEADALVCCIEDNQAPRLNLKGLGSRSHF
jgi:hypothetical protein